MEWITKTWARWTLAILAVISLVILRDSPGSELFLQELAYNMLRALAALVMFEAMLRYSTRKISEAMPAMTKQPTGYQFADMFLQVFQHPIALAIFLAAGMIARGQIVVAVWK